MDVVFAGTPGFAARHLEALAASTHQVTGVVTQPDKPGKRGRKLIPSEVKVAAMAAGLPVIQPPRLKSSHLEAFNCDVLVVVAYGQILKSDVLNLPVNGCINVHASLLPRWRGAAPVQRAILAGDDNFGITLIQMDEGLDTGPILASEPLAIAPGETAGSLFEKLEAVGPPLLIQTLDALASGQLSPRSQPDEGVTYAHKIDKAEAQIDWTGDAAQIDRQVRAFQPDPVAFTTLEDKRIRIHRGQPVESPAGALPGQVLDVTKRGILVNCGSGAYLVDRLQIPVGKGSILSPGDVLNGWTTLIHPGARFTSTG